MTKLRGLATILMVGALAAGCAAPGTRAGRPIETPIATPTSAPIATPTSAPAEKTVETPGCASPSPGERVVVPDATMWNTTHDVDQMINAITAEGAGRFADSYAGIRVDAEHGVTSVYRIPNADFDIFIREVAGPQCFRIHTAKYSHKALEVWMDRVSPDMNTLAKSVGLRSVGIKEDGSGVLIGTKDVAATEAAFRQRYGADAPFIFEKHDYEAGTQ